MTPYETRLQRLRTELVNNGIDLAFLMLSSDLQYLTGVLRPPHNPTDENKHGDEFYGAFLTPEKGPVFVVPRMGASDYVLEQAEGKPWIDDVVVIGDGVLSDVRDPVGVVTEVVEGLGVNPQRIGVSDRLWARAMFALQQAYPDAKMYNLSRVIQKMRAVKDHQETRIMKECGEITDRAFGAVLKNLRLGMTNWDIAREVELQLMRAGGSGVSFHTGIRVTGPTIKPLFAPDGVTPATPLQPGAVIAFDFGVVHSGYASDFGRTVFCGEPSLEFRRYHDLIMEAQAAAIQVMKPGQLTAAELNRVARKVLDDAGVGQYFTHRLGHGIGIDVHEPPFLYELDDTVLQAGMCFTIEPSIRIPDTVAIRVEDVVQVTDEGGVPFSNFSRDLLVI